MEWWEIVGVAILITPLAVTLILLSYSFLVAAVNDFKRKLRRRPSKSPGELKPGFRVSVESESEDEVARYMEELKKRTKRTEKNNTA